jgi:hypothetical protein
MLSAFRPQLLRLLGIGFALGTGSMAYSGDIFCPSHHDGSGSRGLRGITRDGPVYMPTSGTSQQMMGFGMIMPMSGGTNRDFSTDGLTRALEAEHYSIMAASARAAFQAEVEGKQRLLKKLGSLDSGTTTGTANAASDAQITDLKNRLDDLSKKMDDVTRRMTDVERLLLIHDNYFQDLAKRKETAPPTTPVPTTGPMPMPVPMLPPGK